MTEKSEDKKDKDIFHVLSSASIVVLKSEGRRVIREIDKLEKSLEKLEAE